MTHSSRSLSHWKANHSLVCVFGIALNLCVGIPLLFWPDCVLSLLHIPVTDILIWTRCTGGLLILLAVFYAPIIADLDRFRIFAWLQIIPARSSIALFSLIAVVFFGAPAGFLMGTLIEGSVSILLLVCMIRIVGLEQDIATGRAKT